MSPSLQMAPPGSSSYTSNTMSVGDGTWDTSRDIFLLPNLVGLNLATTQYNGTLHAPLSSPTWKTFLTLAQAWVIGFEIYHNIITLFELMA